MRLMFSEEPAYSNSVNNQDFKYFLMWFVDDLEDVFTEFKNRNIDFQYGIEVKPWGLREFGIRDPNGYLIRVAENYL